MTDRQTITPALRQWIIDQAGTGIAAPALIDAMGQVGWAEDVAVRAVEEVLRAHLGEAARAQGLPPAVPVPEPPSPTRRCSSTRATAGSRC